MTISLTPEQLDWISAHVAQGDFASLEDAVRQLIDERIAERAAEDSDDLHWARPLVHEAIAAVEREEVVSLDDHQARIRALMASMKG